MIHKLNSMKPKQKIIKKLNLQKLLQAIKVNKTKQLILLQIMMMKNIITNKINNVYLNIMFKLKICNKKKKIKLLLIIVIKSFYF